MKPLFLCGYTYVGVDFSAVFGQILILFYRAMQMERQHLGILFDGVMRKVFVCLRYVAMVLFVLAAPYSSAPEV